MEETINESNGAIKHTIDQTNSTNNNNNTHNNNFPNKRHAEKTRTHSTCPLADRIAQLTKETYQQICPLSLQQAYQQTVIASIVIQYPPNTFPCSSSSVKPSESLLQVVSLGVGTKVLSSSIVKEEQLFTNQTGQGGHRIRDMHAEILAKRGFQQVLLSEIQRLQTHSSYISPLLTLSSDSSYQIKENIHVHLYTSSQPCGNACIKRWAKSKRVNTYPDLSPDEFPRELHGSIQYLALSEGQIALLTKANQRNHEPNKELTDVNLEIPQLTQGSPDDSGVEVKEDANLLISKGQYYPKGTLPLFKHGNILTCSDKILRWNYLGVQGNLLSYLITPIYLSTIVIGRKFSEIHCQRALCCRLTSIKKSSTSMKTRNNRYELHHPSFLGTKVKFDESIYVLNEELMMKNNANFEESRCFVAWLPSLLSLSSFSSSSAFSEALTTSLTSIPSIISDQLLSNDYVYEILDGSTGLALSTSDNLPGKDIPCHNLPSDKLPNDNVPQTTQLLPDNSVPKNSLPEDSLPKDSFSPKSNNISQLSSESIKQQVIHLLVKTNSIHQETIHQKINDLKNRDLTTCSYEELKLMNQEYLLAKQQLLLLENDSSTNKSNKIESPFVCWYQNHTLIKQK